MSKLVSKPITSKEVEVNLNTGALSKRTYLEYLLNWNVPMVRSMPVAPAQMHPEL